MSVSGTDTFTHKLLMGIGALLLLNTLLLVAVLLRQADIVAEGAGSPTPVVVTSGILGASTDVAVGASGTELNSASMGGEDGYIAGVLKATVEPLEKAATDFGISAEVLPTDAELTAASESGSLESEASQVVLAKLKLGYQKVNMPFPDLAKSAVATTVDLAAAPDGSVAEAETGGRTVQSDILHAYFSVTSQRAVQQAKKDGKEAEVVAPSAAVIEAAAATGDLDSEACKSLLADLRGQYDALELSFPEPAF